MIQDLVNFNKYIIQKYGSNNTLEGTPISNVKAAQISRECISKSFKESIFEDLKKYPFALIFDESSDIFDLPFLCTHVRYVKDGKIINRLLSLEQINEDATEQSLLGNSKTKFLMKKKNQV